MASIIETIKLFDVMSGITQGKSLSSFQVAKVATGFAKALAPTDEGALRNSIMAISDTSNLHGYNNSSGKKAEIPLKSKPKKGDAHFGTALSYGVYQEFGTRRMMAQPYLRPSIAQITGNKVLMDEMKKIIDSYVRKSTKKVISKDTRTFTK